MILDTLAEDVESGVPLLQEEARILIELARNQERQIAMWREYLEIVRTSRDRFGRALIEIGETPCGVPGHAVAVSCGAAAKAIEALAGTPAGKRLAGERGTSSA